ncbi:hypothetical protein [Polaromonas glacialis]|uniref:hypothetical protein n=1 Tax=Polaromonas glacialis TaxID=866564 RepID=UPI0004963FAB|nr:hypothetical protein [Polaromonas glacialis]
MKTTENSRQRLIVSALMQHPDTVAQTTVRLWRQLAPELISIIGEGGFKPLYARSIRLASRQYPWMAHDAAKPADQEGFAELQACLQAQDAALARQASLVLFTIFLDVLASLIGEELTSHLLHSAWPKETSETPAKDLPT